MRRVAVLFYMILIVMNICTRKNFVNALKRKSIKKKQGWGWTTIMCCTTTRADHSDALVRRMKRDLPITWVDEDVRVSKSMVWLDYLIKKRQDQSAGSQLLLLRQSILSSQWKSNSISCVRICHAQLHSCLKFYPDGFFYLFEFESSNKDSSLDCKEGQVEKIKVCMYVCMFAF